MKIQVDDTTRSATAEEIAVVEAQRADVEQTIAERDAKISVRNAALQKLGLTQQEISAIFG